uniref:Uncharacterized protein n=1 Tax=Pyxicephalus adspersus TaxID=30357 RepID=A0AAV3ACG1_PYXAD|nr:TPA: hypothetical protein GDO54_014079 [Pyxicephalus adspersus]
MCLMVCIHRCINSTMYYASSCMHLRYHSCVSVPYLFRAATSPTICVPTSKILSKIFFIIICISVKGFRGQCIYLLLLCAPFLKCIWLC